MSGVSACAEVGGDASALVAAFEAECRLLGDLAGVLRRQREGVASDDVTIVDESVFAANRVVRTLEEARRKRRTLLGLLAGAQDAALDDLEMALGRLMTDDLAKVRDRLKTQARSVAREIEINRRVLRGAMEQGERFMHAICGGPQPRTYEPGESSGAIGALLNRQV